MNSSRNILLFLFVSVLLHACKEYTNIDQTKVNSPQAIHDAMKSLSDVIVYDIFSPPVAARNYAYPSIAAYEAGRWIDSSYISLSSQLNDMPLISAPEKGKTYAFGIASSIALLHSGQHFIFSEEKLKNSKEAYLQSLHQLNIDPTIINNSVEYGEQVANQIIHWAGTDNYKESRSFPRFTILDQVDKWKPTPPGYFDAIEPHWNTIRPFVLDSAAQFKPVLPTTFSLDKSSQFYKELMVVYDTSLSLTQEQKEIAAFWDCNPFVVNVSGHVMHATKKITPGGHWIMITEIASKKANANLLKTLQAYALTSIAISDGFISCWDEKYRSNLVRPESLINDYIDEDWTPLLQTPPFPEYTSGHSVISSAAAIALSAIFGDSFSFHDDSEDVYGLSARDFSSFMDASNEAAISRLYGGIHYMPAITNGVTQGKHLGEFVVKRISFTHSN